MSIGRGVSCAAVIAVVVIAIAACGGSSMESSAPECKTAPPARDGKPCRKSTDCSSSEQCYAPGVDPPNYSGSCGINCGTTTPVSCNNDMACGPGSRCTGTQTIQPCCGGQVTIRTCVTTKCTGASDCAPDERCRADGRCEATPCNEGYACTNGWICDANAYAKDYHGCRAPDCGREKVPCPENQRCKEIVVDPLHGFSCETMSCTTDDDCDCGACVGGRCEKGLGVCLLRPSPPP